MTAHTPLDALHTPTGRIVQVCTTCETDDGDWVLWPCAVVRESRACVSAGQTGCGGVTEGATTTRMGGTDKAIPRSRIWRSGSTGDLTDMEVSAMQQRTPNRPRVVT